MESGVLRNKLWNQSSYSTCKVPRGDYSSQLCWKVFKNEQDAIFSIRTTVGL